MIFENNNLMAMNRILAVLMLVSLTVISSCEKETILTIDLYDLSFTDAGGSQTITLTANKPWTINPNQKWCKVSPAEGEETSNSRISITCEANTSYETRTCTVTITCEELTKQVIVTQAINNGLMVSQTSYDLTKAAQQLNIPVNANVKFSVEIDKGCKDWVKYNTTKALTTSTVVLDISENNSYDGREGKVTIKQDGGSLSSSIIIKQSQLDGLFLTSSEYNLSNGHHTLSVEVSTNVEFEVKPEADWVKYIQTKGLNTKQIVLEIEENDTYDPRETKVNVNQINGDLSGTITIKQDERFGILVTPSEYNLTNEEQTIEVEVKYNVDLEVVIPDDCKDWIKLIPTKSLNCKSYAFSILKNESYDTREGSITFKQKNGPLCGVVSLIQAQSNGLFLSKNQIDLEPESGTFSVTISSNVLYQVQLNSSWIELVDTKGLSKEDVLFSYSANEESVDRTCSIFFVSESGLKEELKIVQYGAGYYRGDVVLLSDDDVYSFNKQSVRTIEGDLIIKNTGTISNLSINNQLRKVLGTIQIEGEKVNITGLENLVYAHTIKLINTNCFSLFNGLNELPGDFYYCYLEPDINNFIGMEWLTKVGGNLSIISPDAYNGLNNIINFNGFNNLTSIGGNLVIKGFFRDLSSFYGFNKLESVGGSIVISNSGYNCFPSLTNFRGFDSLKKICGDFRIGCGMRSLTNFTGMESLRYIGGDVVFIDNWGKGSLLSSLTSFKGWGNVEEIGGALFIGGSISGPIPLQSYSELYSLQKLGGLYIGTLPSLNVSSFTQLSLSRIGKKGVIINNDYISDLYFLRNIEVIEGEFKVKGNSLTNWKGVSNLKEVNTLYIGSLAGYFYSLPTCEGLSSVERVSTLRIGGTDSSANQIHFDNLKGLENLKVIETELIIENTMLSTLEALISLEAIGNNRNADNSIYNRCIYIQNNPYLSKYSSLRHALQNVIDYGIYKNKEELQQHVWIYNNKYNPTVEQILIGKGDE